MTGYFFLFHLRNDVHICDGCCMNFKGKEIKQIINWNNGKKKHPSKADVITIKECLNCNFFIKIYFSYPKYKVENHQHGFYTRHGRNCLQQFPHFAGIIIFILCYAWILLNMHQLTHLTTTIWFTLEKHSNANKRWKRKLFLY